MQEGECMGVNEISECLQYLVGDGNMKTALGPGPLISADDFAQNVLGFEEVEEQEPEDEYNGMGPG